MNKQQKTIIGSLGLALVLATGAKLNLESLARAELRGTRKEITSFKNDIKEQLSRSEISIYDATGDGIDDVVIYDGKTNKCFAFIGKGNGLFEKTDVVMQNGVLTYKTENETYSR